MNLSNLASFVTNTETLVNAGYFEPRGVPVLVSLLTSGVEVEHLRLLLCAFDSEFSADLVCAMKHSIVRSLALKAYDVCTDEIYKKLAESIGTQLERLEIENADFHLNYVASFQALLARCTGITHLALNQCEFDAQWKWMLDSTIASQLQSLESLKLCYVDMNDSSLAKLLGELHGLIHLSELIILGCKDFGKGCAAAICGLTRLKRLELGNHNSLDDDGMTALAEGSPVFVLRWLIFGCNSIGPVGGASLARMIARCPNLCELGLPKKIGPDAARKLGEAVKHSGCARSLCKLNIAECELDQTGVVDLFSATNFPALTLLNMSYNAAGDAGAKTVSDCLLRSQAKLEELHAEYVKITAVGAVDLSRVFGSILILNLRDNQIGPEGGVTVINQLISAKRRHLKELNLSLCNLGDIGAEAVGRLIGCCRCRRILLSDNNIHAAGAKAITDACKAAQKIDMLSLNENPIGDQGAGYIAEGIIKTNRAVEELEISNIGIGDSGVSSIIAALKEMNREGPLMHLMLREEEFTWEQREVLEQLARGGRNQWQFGIYFDCPDPNAN